MAANTSTLIPSDPEKVMVIRHLTPEVLICSTPFARFGRIHVGGRGTVVKLTSGNLAVFSPVALTESVKKELSTMGSGDIKYIVALDLEHHIFLESWHKAFPSARVLAPEGLPEARDKQGYFKLPHDNLRLFTADDHKAGKYNVSEEFDQDFDVEYVPAHPNKDLVFNHRPSRTLIEADVLFNLPATEQYSKTGISPESTILDRIFTTLNSPRGSGIWQRRFLWYLLTASGGDRSGWNRSMAKIDGWNFDKIVPCHGDVVESNGKGVFQKVMEWHLAAAKKEQ